MKCINKGLTAEIYLTKGDKILKLFFPDTYEPRKKREFGILDNITVKEGSKLNVPTVLEYVEIENRSGFIMEQYQYSSLEDKYKMRIIKKVKKTAKVCQMIRTDISINGDYYIKDFIRPIIEEAEIPIDMKNFLHKTLNDLPNGETVCHGDLHGENILLPNQDEYMLIDWSEGGKGDYLFEIAKMLTVYQYHPYPLFEKNALGRNGIVSNITYKVNKKLLDLFLKEMSYVETIDMERLQKWQMLLDTMLLKRADGKRNESVYSKMMLSYQYFK